MELEALHREPAADNEINWVTATFMGLFHVRSEERRVGKECVP